MEKIFENIPMDLLIAGTAALLVIAISVYEIRIAFRKKDSNPFKDKFDGYL